MTGALARSRATIGAMHDISQNILDEPARRWRQIGDMMHADDGVPNVTGQLCARRFTRAMGVAVVVMFTTVHTKTLTLDAWFGLLFETGQTIDFRHITGTVDGIGVSELWAVDRLASRDDELAMRARKQFTPAQRAVVAEWHKRELAMLAKERA